MQSTGITIDARLSDEEMSNQYRDLSDDNILALERLATQAQEARDHGNKQPLKSLVVKAREQLARDAPEVPVEVPDAGAQLVPFGESLRRDAETARANVRREKARTRRQMQTINNEMFARDAPGGSGRERLIEVVANDFPSLDAGEFLSEEVSSGSRVTTFRWRHDVVEELAKKASGVRQHGDVSAADMHRGMTSTYRDYIRTIAHEDTKEVKDAEPIKLGHCYRAMRCLCDTSFGQPALKMWLNFRTTLKREYDVAGRKSVVDSGQATMLLLGWGRADEDGVSLVQTEFWVHLADVMWTPYVQFYHIMKASTDDENCPSPTLSDFSVDADGCLVCPDVDRIIRLTSQHRYMDHYELPLSLNQELRWTGTFANVCSRKRLIASFVPETLEVSIGLASKSLHVLHDPWARRRKRARAGIDVGATS